MSSNEELQKFKKMRDDLNDIILALEKEENTATEVKAGEKEKKEYMREYMRGYMREWSKKNPEKVKETQKRYWINRAKKNSI